MAKWLVDNGFTSDDVLYLANGYYAASSSQPTRQIVGIYAPSANAIVCVTYATDYTLSNNTIIAANGYSNINIGNITGDIVLQL